MFDSLRPHGLKLQGSFVHGISQARTLKWIAVSFSRGSSWPRDWICVSCIEGRFLSLWAIREVPSPVGMMLICSAIVFTFQGYQKSHSRHTELWTKKCPLDHIFGGRLKRSNRRDIHVFLYPFLHEGYAVISFLIGTFCTYKGIICIWHFTWDKVYDMMIWYTYTL